MMMDIERFVELAAAWGGDITCWPKEDQSAARELLAVSRQAQDALSDAAQLDAVLAQVHNETVLPSDLLSRKILANAPVPVFGSSWKRPAIAAATAMVIGLAGGFGGGFLLPTPQQYEADYEYADAYDGLLEDWSAWEWSDA